MNELGVVGFGHIGTYIRDMEVSKKFYMEVLGFHILYECLHEYSGNKLCFLQNQNCVVELSLKAKSSWIRSWAKTACIMSCSAARMASICRSPKPSKGFSAAAL